MILYHFTSTHHLPKILEDGRLKVTESNLSRTRVHAGPDVVWLTSDPMPASQEWAGGSQVDKAEIRFTVRVPAQQAGKWRKWARAHGIDPGWARALTVAGDSGSWYVIERAVPAAEWAEIANMRTGELISHLSGRTMATSNTNNAPA